MKFLADENFDRPVIDSLRKNGFEVFSVSEELPQAIDEVVLEMANSQKCILLTSDKDFGELVFRLKLITTGIILLRLPDLTNTAKAALLISCLKEYQEEFPGSFAVITSKKVRIVKL